MIDLNIILVWVYSAETENNNNPLNRPRRDGFVLKSQVNDDDKEKLLNVFMRINQGTDNQGIVANDNFVKPPQGLLKTKRLR